MKRRVMLFIILLFFWNLIYIEADAGEKRQAEILFTHDLHSHLDEFKVQADGGCLKTGGFARLKTIIDNKKESCPELLIIDSGDFSMGTLYQTLYRDEAVELRMLGCLGYDAVTLGNHEFDYRMEGLADMLKAAVNSGDKLPVLVLSNAVFREEEKEPALLKDAFEEYGAKDYIILEKAGVKIAVLGIFGKDALACAPACTLTFEDAADAVKRTIAQIQETEQADMYVCLSHSGIWENKKKSEDELLAKAVPELDVIISGHTHSTLDEPITIGETHIVACGEYGMKAGSLSLVQKNNGRWAVKAYELIPLTQDIVQDFDVLERLKTFREGIEERYLRNLGYSMNQVLCYNPYIYPTVRELENTHREEPLGNLLADAYRYAISLPAQNTGAADVAIVPSGVVRASFTPGEITVADAFEISSLGTGPDGIAGYPLVRVYLTGKELKIIAEIDASISPQLTTARLYISGMGFCYNPDRLFLNRVTDVWLIDKNDERIEILDDKLYKVTADLYTGQMLGLVNKSSAGFLSIVPKDENGAAVENLEDFIVYKGESELKAWQAVAMYLESFQAMDGRIPEYYAAAHSRKTAETTHSLWDILKCPNGIAVLFACIFSAALFSITILIVYCTKKIRKRYGKPSY